MSNGFKKSKAPTTKDRIRQLEVDFKNVQMALNISQMMVKQLMSQVEMMRQDAANSLNLANDLQYRTLAMINLMNIDTNALDAEADKLKLKDYNEASDKEDVEKGYTIGDVVKEESIVIISSTTDTDVDQGIFRSKIPVVQIPYEAMKNDMIGKKVGDKFQADINGVIHNVEIIGIRELPAKLELVSDEPGCCCECHADDNEACETTCCENCNK